MTDIPTIRIVHRFDRRVLWEGPASTIKAAIHAALKSGATLSGATLFGATLSRANLFGADLSRADLSRADLFGADLSRADLSRATLSRADLSRANLFGANLFGAKLSGAIGISPERCTPLFMLRDQPGIIHAYKLVTANGIGPFTGGITYQIGRSYEVAEANTDPLEQCGAGINVATLDWCLMNYSAGYRVFIVAFTAADIAVIPTATDGKFRLFRCTVVSEKDIAALIAPVPVEVPA